MTDRDEAKIKEIVRRLKAGDGCPAYSYPPAHIAYHAKLALDQRPHAEIEELIELTRLWMS